MAVVSDDHACEKLCVENLAPSSAPMQTGPRPISADEVKQHSGADGPFWAVIDGFVVDATAFVKTHPGGLKKLLSTDTPQAGATGRDFGFSFSRGRNAHFPETGKRFHDGVQRYLSSKSDGPFLSPAEVAFPPYGTMIILGRFEG
eukprot:gene11198-13234_t